MFSSPQRFSEDHFEAQKVIWGHFNNLAVFVKPKKRSSAPSRGRIQWVSDLLYQSLKNSPDGTRCKKNIQQFFLTIILLFIGHQTVGHANMGSRLTYDVASPTIDRLCTFDVPYKINKIFILCIVINLIADHVKFKPLRLFKIIYSISLFLIYFY